MQRLLSTKHAYPNSQRVIQSEADCRPHNDPLSPVLLSLFSSHIVQKGFKDILMDRRLVYAFRTGEISLSA